MKNNRIFLALLLMTPIFMICIWLGSLQIKTTFAKEVLVSVTGYDPRDLLSGHYIVLRPQWDKTDCAQFAKEVCPKELFDYSYRFYLPENDAKYLDRVVSRRNDLDMQLKFALPTDNSFPLVKELYIEQMPWREWLKQNPPTKFDI